MQKKSLKIILFGLIIIAFSCSKNKQSRVSENQSVEIETPKVLLKDDEISLDIISSKRGYRGDLIEELFKEACSKDENLGKLQKRISKEIIETEKLLYELDEYQRLTARVLTSIKMHSQRIKNDSLLSKEMVKLSLLSEEKFQEKIKEHLNSESEIIRKKINLENKLIELKIRIGLEMLRGFQDNEIPPKEPLTKKNEILEQLLSQIKEEINN